MSISITFEQAKNLKVGNVISRRVISISKIAKEINAIKVSYILIRKQEPYFIFEVDVTRACIPLTPLDLIDGTFYLDNPEEDEEII